MRLRLLARENISDPHPLVQIRLRLQIVSPSGSDLVRRLTRLGVGEKLIVGRQEIRTPACIEGGVRTVRVLGILLVEMCLGAVIVLPNPRLMPTRQRIMNLAGHEVVARYPSRLGDPLAQSCFSPKALVALPNERYLIKCGGGFALFNRATE